MSDTISRQDAIDALEKGKDITANGEVGGFYNAIIQHDIDKIKQLPSAEPEIIRCRDCKHHDGIRCFRWNSTIITGFDDYCSNAERRGEHE